MVMKKNQSSETSDLMLWVIKQSDRMKIKVIHPVEYDSTDVDYFYVKRASN